MLATPLSAPCAVIVSNEGWCCNFTMAKSIILQIFHNLYALTSISLKTANRIPHLCCVFYSLCGVLYVLTGLVHAFTNALGGLVNTVINCACSVIHSLQSTKIHAQVARCFVGGQAACRGQQLVLAPTHLVATGQGGPENP